MNQPGQPDQALPGPAVPGGRREVYVYWKLPQADAGAATAAAHAMQAELRAAQPGLVGSLHRRAEIRQGLVTLMETYAHPDGVNDDHQAAIAAAASRHLAAWAEAPRHVEVFESLQA